MAPNFGPSISFPLTPGRSFSKPRHVRSVSLPCATSSHPLLANLNVHIAALRSWIQQDTAASFPVGLAAIHALHAALAAILLLPESRRATSIVGDRLLEAFLLLADAYQGFQECLIELKHAAAESSAALRRGDGPRFASAARCQRRAEKKLARLAASVSSVFSKSARLNLLKTGEDADMAGTLVEAAFASAAASAALFSAAAFASSAASSCKKTATFIPAFARKSATPETSEATGERLHALERCFDECGGVCDMVFRSVVQTRVSLLNIMMPTI